jgi:hypothetical protein
MNDVGRDLYTPNIEKPDLEESRQRRIENYEKSLREIIDTIQAANVQVILMTPSIYDETALMDTPNSPGVNQTGLRECARRVGDIGRQLGLPVVDFFHPMLEINEHLQKEDPAFTLIGKDRVHPGAPGHLVMAWLFLKAQNVPNAIAKVSLNAENGQVVESSNCAVDEVQASRNGVRFRYNARALPFPIEDSAKAALAWGSIMQDLNQEILQVDGLAPSTYRLLIDDVPIRTFTAGELSAGVNLAAEETTPQYRQAKTVLQLAKERWETAVTLRDIVLVESGTMGNDFPRPLSFDQVQPRLEKRIKEITGSSSEAYHRRMIEAYIQNKPHEAELLRKAAEMQEEIRKAAQPKSHVIELVDVGGNAAR